MKIQTPRGKIQNLNRLRLIRHMKLKGWAVFKVGAGKFVAGWPDYYCYHHLHGHRWIETKNKGEKLTPAQKKRFKMLAEAGDKIFVLEIEEHYQRLFRDKDNWRHYY